MKQQQEICIPVKRLPGQDDIDLPRYMTTHAAGMDVRAAVSAIETLQPGEWKKIPAGFVMALPEGFEAQIRPRSGLAMEFGVTLLNAPGTIDADYRGEVGIILINHGKRPFDVKRGDRIAQMIIQPVCKGCWQEQDTLSLTVRGAGGFGHTRSS
ncbi:MAG TPA: dUTP diphosphatase [Syntrophales bacterium]|nr:dUTP diphosphatase [Syntrophales bacterium]